MLLESLKHVGLSGLGDFRGGDIDILECWRGSPRHL
jgi:hypothetical protein